MWLFWTSFQISFKPYPWYQQLPHVLALGGWQFLGGWQLPVFLAISRALAIPFFVAPVEPNFISRQDWLPSWMFFTEPISNRYGVDSIAMDVIKQWVPLWMINYCLVVLVKFLAFVITCFPFLRHGSTSPGVHCIQLHSITKVFLLLPFTKSK